MKVTHITHYGTKGGAAVAIADLHHELRRLGLDSRCLVAAHPLDESTSTCAPPTLLERHVLQYLPWLTEFPLGLGRVLRETHHPLNLCWLPRFQVTAHPWVREADIINLHWTIFGIITPEQISRISQPIVWRLTDCWSFTGGCAYPGDCQGYESACGQCPLLGAEKESDASRKLWNRKRMAYRQGQMTIVTPSRWMADRARSSSLFRSFRVETIPTGIDTDFFHPEPNQNIRKKLEIPTGHPVLALGAADPSDPRKGFDLAAKVITQAADILNQPVHVLLFGGEYSLPSLPPKVTVHSLGKVDRAALPAIYNAADVFLAPAREENLAKMVLESMSCGTPVAAFAVGGMADCVRNGESGFLVSPFDVATMAEMVAGFLGDQKRSEGLRVASRHLAVKEFSLPGQAARYADLYKELLSP